MTHIFKDKSMCCEENKRVSVDYDRSGKEVPESLHYTDQNAPKGDNTRHNH